MKTMNTVIGKQYNLGAAKTFNTVTGSTLADVDATDLGEEGGTQENYRVMNASSTETVSNFDDYYSLCPVGPSKTTSRLPSLSGLVRVIAAH